ncbi:MAG: S24 family peptidase [Chromatiales bacterium]|nr:S24 family peptidase [Chromatiales bacterium]
MPLYKVMVSAGPGAVVEGERIDAQLAFRKDWLRRIGLQTCQLALVRADGDSMQPTINDGDALLIDTSKCQLTDGHIYVMRINDELRAKRLQRLVDGSVRVSSDNTIYADEVVDASDLDQLHILGRVVWKGGLI